MQNNSQKRKKKISSTILGLSIVGVILLGFILWITPWVWYDNSPKPLGDRLEYVGKKDYGCWLGFCDSKPGTTYYYATDMSVEEVKSYFKKATLHDYSKANSFLDYSTLEFHSPQGIFDVKFYKDKTAEANYIGVRVPKKANLLSIPYFSFPVAQSSL